MAQRETAAVRRPAYDGFIVFVDAGDLVSGVESHGADCLFSVASTWHGVHRHE